MKHEFIESYNDRVITYSGGINVHIIPQAICFSGCSHVMLHRVLYPGVHNNGRQGRVRTGCRGYVCSAEGKRRMYCKEIGSIAAETECRSVFIRGTEYGNSF